jgi:lipopolysaccharide biosynthesis glycosyltransferase
MKDLVYYTVGYSSAYIDVLKISIDSLQKSGWNGDIAIICDQSFLNQCKQLFGESVLYLSFPDSTSPEQASMNKLRIFELPTISSYERILFLDSDIIVHMNIETIISKITDRDKLYVYTETRKYEDHLSIMWSLNTYTQNDIDFFKKNSIYVFNAGCFAFICDDKMKSHFLNIQYMISTHKERFFYEQSFMNVYFNKNNKTVRDLITDYNYAFPPKEGIDYKGKLLHFAGDPGSGKNKLYRMQNYMRQFFTT